jgi:small conductance mechanosensitive channel
MVAKGTGRRMRGYDRFAADCQCIIDVVSGIFAGAAVNFEKTFQIGDLVTISNIKGTVEDISMLTTKLRTENGETVYVPNQLIFNTPFINHSKKS